MKAIATVERTNLILNKYNLHARKKLGQNFIINNNIIENIVTEAKLNDDNFVLEIGPGIGALTWELAKTKLPILSVEIDNDLIPALREEVSQYFDNSKIINADILKTNLLELFKNNFDNFKNDNKIVVIANLPYYITKAILLFLINQNIKITKMILMVQKEVANKLTGDIKKNNAFINIMNLYSETKILFDVNKDNFQPIPQVDSAIIEIKLVDKFVNLDKKQIISFIKKAFLQKRKTLINNLKNYYEVEKIKTVLEKNNISLNIRSEKLTTNQLINIFKGVD